MLSVDDSYLDQTFRDYNITSGSSSVPDVAQHLEKTMSDKQAMLKLSPESYTRFRKALGKLLWLSQSRHDLKLFMSIIGTQQSEPMQGTESALRSVLRFLYHDKGVRLMLPTPEYDVLNLPNKKRIGQYLHSFSDASFGPYRFNKRRGNSGGVILCEGGVVRTFAKQQQALSLSSCEAELYALQLLSQESVSFGKFVHRMLFCLDEVSEAEDVSVLLESDSSSALQLVQALDMPKRSRHVEIRLLWLREQVGSGKISIQHRPGTDNISDLFTKCLPTRTYMKHRTTLGFLKIEAPIQELTAMYVSKGCSAIAIVELCCSTNSCIRKACETSKIPYCGVVENVELRGTQMSVSQFISSKKSEGHWIHMHVSTPCSSGPPLKRFSPDSVTASDLEWETIMTSVPAYFRFALKPDSASFELPKHNDIWKRDKTIKALSEGELVFDQDVYLCQAQYRASNGLPIGKVLRFVSNHKPFCDSLFARFGVCTCREHASLSNVTWSDTGYYNPILSRAILNAAKACMRKSKPGRPSWRDGSLGVQKGDGKSVLALPVFWEVVLFWSFVLVSSRFSVWWNLENSQKFFLWDVENIVTCDVGAEA